MQASGCVFGFAPFLVQGVVERLEIIQAQQRASARQRIPHNGFALLRVSGAGDGQA